MCLQLLLVFTKYLLSFRLSTFFFLLYSISQFILVVFHLIETQWLLLSSTHKFYLYFIPLQVPQGLQPGLPMLFLLPPSLSFFTLHAGHHPTFYYLSLPLTFSLSLNYYHFNVLLQLCSLSLSLCTACRASRTKGKASECNVAVKELLKNILSSFQPPLLKCVCFFTLATAHCFSSFFYYFASITDSKCKVFTCYKSPTTEESELHNLSKVIFQFASEKVDEAKKMEEEMFGIEVELLFLFFSMSSSPNLILNLAMM